jgi:hypothetical protein
MSASSDSRRGVAPLPVELGEQLDLLAPRLGVQVAGDGVLGQRRRAEHLRLGGQHQLLADGERGEHPADPQARGERLGERAEVDDPVGVAGAQARIGSWSKPSRP